MENRFREAVLTLDFNSTLGRSQVSPESNADFYTTTIPLYMVEQDQGGRRIPIAWHRHGEALQIVDGEKFKWNTFDGIAPKDRLVVIHISERVPSGIVVLLKVIAGLFWFWSLVTVALLIKMRKCNGYLDTFRRFNFTLVIGCIVPSLAIFMFPINGESSNTFCIAASITSIVGLYLVMGSITTKMLVVSFSRNRGPIRNLNKVKLHASLMFVVIALIVTGLVILQTFVGGLPTANFHVNKSLPNTFKLAILNVQVDQTTCTFGILKHVCHF